MNSRISSMWRSIWAPGNRWKLLITLPLFILVLPLLVFRGDRIVDRFRALHLLAAPSKSKSQGVLSDEKTRDADIYPLW